MVIKIYNLRWTHVLFLYQMLESILLRLDRLFADIGLIAVLERHGLYNKEKPNPVLFLLFKVI